MDLTKEYTDIPISLETDPFSWSFFKPGFSFSSAIKRSPNSSVIVGLGVVAGSNISIGELLQQFGSQWGPYLSIKESTSLDAVLLKESPRATCGFSSRAGNKSVNPNWYVFNSQYDVNVSLKSMMNQPCQKIKIFECLRWQYYDMILIRLWKSTCTIGRLLLVLCVFNLANRTK